MPSFLTRAQQVALDGIADELAQLSTAAGTARTALAAATFASPHNEADLQAKLTDLATAELNLARARAERFDRAPILRSLSTSQIATVNQQGGRGSGRGGLVQPRSADDSEGFVPIFNGKTLEGWDGNSTFWRVEEGKIVGESTPEKVVTANNFLIWRGGTVKDFELKVEFRLNGGNSGIQYRSQEAANWVLRGYQADMDFPNQYTGQVHDEAGRNIMAPRGQFVRAAGNGVYKVLAMLGDSNEIAASVIPNGWNSYQVMARGPVLIHIINGRVSGMLIDEDPANRDLEGLIGLQMHTGAPFKIEYRNLLLRTL